MGGATPDLHVYGNWTLQGTSAVYAAVKVHDGAALTVGPGFALQAATVSVGNGATVTVGGGSALNISDSLYVGSNGTVVCQGRNNTGADTNGQWVGVGVQINASNVIVEATGKITADGQGYAAVYNHVTGLGLGGAVPDSGGSYGGLGGYGDVGGALGLTYGSAAQPTDLGSSGGAWNGYWSGAGGGAIRMALTGMLTLNGAITANGTPGGYSSGGGAGGSVWVTTRGLAGAGSFLAGGGNGGSNGGGGGGGGRIAVY